jgi:hypothetical protein
MASGVALRPAGAARTQSRSAVILTLIALIMLTDLVSSAFRFAKWAVWFRRSHEQSWAWIGGPLAHALAGLTAALDWGYQAFYWVQMATVFAFLAAILPVGEHFHIVTALPALYWARRARQPCSAR